MNSELSSIHALKKMCLLFLWGSDFAYIPKLVAFPNESIREMSGFESFKVSYIVFFILGEKYKFSLWTHKMAQQVSDIKPQN